MSCAGKRKPNGYWTKERCATAALRYSHRQDFAKAEPSACAIARRNGWMNDISAHMSPKANKLSRHLYAIVDLDRDVAYVGLTYDPVARAAAHRRSPKMNAAFPNGIDFQILLSGLTEEEASRNEANLIECMRVAGFEMVNVQPGGGLGGTRRKHTFDACKAEASKHGSRKEFQSAAKYAFVTASRMGWLDEICSHMPPPRRLRWTVPEILAEAAKFSTLEAFRAELDGAWQAACRLGVAPTVRSMLPAKRKPRGYWTLDMIAAAAAKFGSMAEFSANEPSAYTTAAHNKWLDDIRAQFKAAPEAGVQPRVIDGEAPVQVAAASA